MQSINEIQNHLQGMEDIKHLLRSVRAMSAIRWRRAKQHLQIAKDYAAQVDAQLSTIFAKTGTNIPASLSSKSAQTHPKPIVGLITLTSDRGLCGSFNTGLVSKGIHVTEIINRKGKEVRIISLGGYGERLFRNAGYEIFFSEQIPSQQAVSFVNMRKIIAHIRAFYETQAIDELNILYNQFNYFGSYTPKSVQILPPTLEDLQAQPARLYLAYIESTISEHSARLQTMDSAISNLEERVGELEIQYHSIRQEKITQDVLEVQSNIRERKKKK